MQIIFTKSNSILSKIIRSITKEDVSHTALLVDDKWVIHSNLLGVRIDYLYNFVTHCQIVDTVELPNNNFPLYKTLRKKQGSLYDFGAFLFLGLVLILRRFFPRFVQKRNLWQTTGMFLCTEWCTEIVDGKENSMLTPGQLRTLLQETYNG